jgi:hypothetical protein
MIPISIADARVLRSLAARAREQARELHAALRPV